MKNTKWRLKKVPNNKELKLDDISVDNDILKILYSRGIKSNKDIKNFLNPKLDNIQNPNNLYDMGKATKIIIEAIKKNKNIWIYGDYDVDGITSTSILYLALKELGASNVNYYIPIRDEGYGLNNEALKKIKNSACDLVITVDCGITAFSEVEYANSINLPMIITDHHNLSGNSVPKALAVINPKRYENTFSFESLAGVGTIFMVILNLFDKLGKKEEAYKYLDLVSIGTIADIVPLLEENRILVKYGLDLLPYTQNKGLRYLLYKLFDENNKNQNGETSPKLEYSTYDVGFIIAPVFNAAGRLKDAKMVVKLLISDNNREIEIIVKELINKNFERKELQNNITELVEKNIEEKGYNNDYVIVDYSKEYHHGVIGIVASKIVDTYYKPTIIMEVKEDEKIAIGSCRSIEGFNILEALQSMPELFIKFGGHFGAAGFTISIKNIELFRKKINEFAKNKLSKEDFIKIIDIDKKIPIQKISYEFFKVIELMKPFGFGNPSPTFMTKNILLENVKYIGENKNHIMFDFKQKDFNCRNAVWFGGGEYFKELSENLFYDIVYKLKVESYQDKFYTKIYIDDIKKSDLEDDTLSFYYSMFRTSFPQKSIFYTNLEINEDIPISMKIDFDQISLFQGRKFIGRLDYNISNLLIQLRKYYNWNFNIKIENINKTITHTIVDIIIKRDYHFECYEYTNIGIFNKIKKYLINNMEYSSITKKMLASFFHNKNNLIIVNDSVDNNHLTDKLENFVMTLGLYFYTTEEKKSKLIIKNTKKIKNNLIKNYFNIVSKYENVSDKQLFTIFYIEKIDDEFMNMLEKDFISKNKRFCVILDIDKKGENKKLVLDYCKNNKINNIEIIENKITIPKNITLLSSMKKIDKKELNNKNVYLEYLPLEEKMKIKERLDNGQPIYSDDSVVDIL